MYIHESALYMKVHELVQYRWCNGCQVQHMTTIEISNSTACLQFSLECIISVLYTCNWPVSLSYVDVVFVRF